MRGLRVSDILRAFRRKPIAVDVGADMPGRTLRVLVADDNENVRRTIRQVLGSETDMEIVCEAVDGADALCKVREHRPDVVLLDITMPSLNGLEVAEVIKQESPSVQVLIVTQHDSQGFKWAALAAGVSGYVFKSNVSRDLIPELRRIRGLFRSAIGSFPRDA